jgi:transcriptional regulator with XRE-family HTH domain
MADDFTLVLAGLLRQLRKRMGLTQEELAERASLSVRSVSDMERGITLTARRESVRLLADALGLAGPERERFEAVARGRVEGAGFAGATRTLPRDVASFTGRKRELAQLADGNLVEYGPGGAMWSSNTPGSGSSNRLVMQADGNVTLVEFPGCKPPHQEIFWSGALIQRRSKPRARPRAHGMPRT